MAYLFFKSTESTVSVLPKSCFNEIAEPQRTEREELTGRNEAALFSSLEIGHVRAAKMRMTQNRQDNGEDRNTENTQR